MSARDEFPVQAFGLPTEAGKTILAMYEEIDFLRSRCEKLAQRLQQHASDEAL